VCWAIGWSKNLQETYGNLWKSPSFIDFMKKVGNIFKFLVRCALLIKWNCEFVVIYGKFLLVQSPLFVAQTTQRCLLVQRLMLDCFGSLRIIVLVVQASGRCSELHKTAVTAQIAQIPIVFCKRQILGNASYCIVIHPPIHCRVRTQSCGRWAKRPFKRWCLASQSQHVTAAVAWIAVDRDIGHIWTLCEKIILSDCICQYLLWSPGKICLDSSPPAFL
jgi:hypothetical protein